MAHGWTISTIYLLCCLVGRGHTQFVKSAVRIRFNDGIFMQVSRIVERLYENRVMHLTLANEQQCFVEGCVQIFALHITAHRPPTFVVLSPNPPNLMTLALTDLDLYITGSISGQLQLLPPIPISFPVAGTLSVKAVRVEVNVVLDLQKNNDDKPYIRTVSCYIRKGDISAKVENMGLITDIVNFKYKDEMGEKAHEVLQRTVCGNVQQIVEEEFNNRIAKLPNVLSVKEMVQTFVKNYKKQRKTRSVPPQKIINTGQVTRGYSNLMPIGKHKRKRAYSEQNLTLLAAASSINQQSPVPTAVPVTISTESQHGSTFNIEKLSPLMLSLSVLDTSATYDKFFIGVNGDVFLNEHTPVKNPYIRPESLKFVTPSKGKSLELLLSEYTINTLLLNAHNVGATVLRVGSQTPVFGKLLRTTCTLDEVCLSDSIPEAGEKYPDRQLEIIIRTTKAPNVRLIADTAMITVEGRSLFYLEGTTQKIGTIPFETTISFNLRTQRNKIHGSVSVLSIEFHKDVDFFEVPVDSLNGLRDATKGAFENMFNKKLNNGTKIEMNDVSSIRNPSVAIVNKALLIQTDYDLRKHFNMNPLRNHNLS